MRRVLHGAAALGLLALAACGSGGGPRAGDTVTPQLNGGINWTAGKPGQLGIRLTATNADGSGPRSLDFGGIPANVNPVATVQFFGSDFQHPDQQITIGHRC